MDYSKFIKEDEKIELSATQDKLSYLKNSLLGNILYIILWIGFDIFFVYVITMDGIKEQFWYTLITVAGLNLLRVWTYVFKCLKDFEFLKTSAYVLTDKALYFINDGKYKSVKRIDFSEIVVVEKSEYYCDGFYVASEKENIQVINIKNESELFTKIANLVKQS